MTRAWARIDAWLERRGVTVADLHPPASAEALAAATRLPPSLRALYAAHDGFTGVADILGLGGVVWWRLADVARLPAVDVEGTTFVVFGAPYDEDVLDPDDLPRPDDGAEVVVAVDTRREKVAIVRVDKHRIQEELADDLGAALERVSESLASGMTVIDENGRLQDPPAESMPPPARRASAAATPPPAALVEFATLLVQRGFVELREGAAPKDLAAALDTALESESRKMRMRAVLAVFENDPVVAEVFADDDELERIAKELV